MRDIEATSTYLTQQHKADVLRLCCVTIVGTFTGYISKIHALSELKPNTTYIYIYMIKS